MNIRDDKETEQIGKLIDAGHAELAVKALISRFRHRTIWVCCGAVAPVGGAIALAIRYWH
jgi:hypothetical protein